MKGIDYLEETLRIALESPANDNVLRTLRLASLANAYDIRFQRFKQTGNLTNAIEYGYSARKYPQEGQEREYNLFRLPWARHQVGTNRKDLGLENGELTAKIGDAGQTSTEAIWQLKALHLNFG